MDYRATKPSGGICADQVSCLKVASASKLYNAFLQIVDLCHYIEDIQKFAYGQQISTKTRLLLMIETDNCAHAFFLQFVTKIKLRNIGQDVLRGGKLFNSCLVVYLAWGR